MSTFDIFRRHVETRPDAVAVVTPYRVATYRKMWSRIERSTARLQGEWMVSPGATIAYLGCGHLDALVMYLAAARCGVRVLPLEHANLQQQAGALLAREAVTLVLHDDTLTVDAGLLGVPCRALSTLIATVCRHRASVVEDCAAVSLLEFDDDHLALALRARSLDALEATALTCPAGHFVVRGALFDQAIFAPVVMAALLVGATLALHPPEA